MENLELSHRSIGERAKDYKALIDVTFNAKKLGFNCPVAITGNLWDRYITPAPELQDETVMARVRDTLIMLKATINSTLYPGDCIWFRVSFKIYIDGKYTARETNLKYTVSRGYYGGIPGITIMLPKEY
jgi:hypothetical protein